MHLNKAFANNIPNHKLLDLFYLKVISQEVILVTRNLFKRYYFENLQQAFRLDQFVQKFPNLY